MIEVVLDLRTWGNSLAVRLPAAIAREANLHVEQTVRISVVDGKVIIAPVLNEPLTLEKLLEKFNPELHGGEAMPTAQRLGAEQW
jgi:antitoxin MazE